MLFLFFPSFLINHFSTGARSIPRHFHTPPLKTLNLDKKKEKKKERITLNFTIPSHELVVIYSGIDIKRLDKRREKKRKETPSFRVSVRTSECTVACNYARQLDTLRNVILNFSPFSGILSHRKNIPSIIVPTVPRGGTTRETFTQREQRLRDQDSCRDLSGRAHASECS